MTVLACTLRQLKIDVLPAPLGPGKQLIAQHLETDAGDSRDAAESHGDVVQGEQWRSIDSALIKSLLEIHLRRGLGGTYIR